MRKRKSRSEVLFDKDDLLILDILEYNKDICMTDLKKRTGLSYSALMVHIKRIKYFVEIKRLPSPKHHFKIININKKGKLLHGLFSFYYF